MTDPSISDLQLLDMLRLNLVHEIGLRMQQLLANRFGTPAGVFAVSSEQWQQVSGIGAKLAAAIADQRSHGRR